VNLGGDIFRWRKNVPNYRLSILSNK